MIKKYLLKKISKPLDQAGLGHAPATIHALLHRPDLISNALAVAFIQHVGAFDSLGMLFFSLRVMKKLSPKSNCKGVTNHASTQQQKEKVD